MTVDAMVKLGFTESAAGQAGKANARIDDQQGNTSAETNLHAMCAPGQSDSDCRKAVDKIIADGRQSVIDTVVSALSQKAPAAWYEAALKSLGETLHTIQDYSFHKYEPWPYRGIGDALLRDPNYMICHAIRDLGFVSITNTIDVNASLRIGREAYIGVQGFFRLPSNPDPPRGGEPPGFSGAGGMLTFTFGAAPGSVHVRDPFPDGRGVADSHYSSMLASGRADLSRAEDATEDFIKNIEKDVEKKPDGGQAWLLFLHFQSNVAP
jgi:hypothetical protein